MGDDAGSKLPDLGGDPVCWLSRVCAECGLILDDESSAPCPRCLTPREAD